MDKEVLDYSAVFVPGGFPLHTYNPRDSLNLETKLADSTKNLCKLIVVTGQTKSGKTVLTRKILPRDKAIWIDAGSVSHEDEFWQIILESLDLAQEHQIQVTKGTTKTLGTEGKVESGLIVAKASGQLSFDWSRQHGDNYSSSRHLSSRIASLKGLKEKNAPLVIDDFHYLPKEMQGTLIRALKPLIFDGLTVIIIAIPHRRYEAMKVEREMTGRIMPIDIPIWKEDELQFIPQTGFSLLGYNISPEHTKYLAEESIGSPHLMQDFCRGICKAINLRHSSERQELTLSKTEIDSSLKEVSKSIGRPIFEKLSHGPRQRTDRIQRELVGGQKVDIYELVLKALANLKPGLISLEYEDIRSSIREIAPKPSPQLHEVARVLKHMSTIASSDLSSTPVIDFDEDEKKLHITDPFFAFYLRWGDLNT
ncbi:hypothetical protein ACFLVB_03865 [Chloroflexota bacterium]